MATVRMTVEMTDAEASDILCTALEGGIGYWSAAANIQRVDDAEDSVGWRYLSFDLYDAEDHDDLFGTVNYETVRKGCNLILNGEVKVNSYITNMVRANFTDDEPMDADGADCVVQAGLFGEVVYG